MSIVHTLERRFKAVARYYPEVRMRRLEIALNEHLTIEVRSYDEPETDGCDAAVGVFLPEIASWWFWAGEDPRDPMFRSLPEALKWATKELRSRLDSATQSLHELEEELGQ